MTFNRPLLEYSCEVGDSCTVADAGRLEQLQLEAARIVTGLTAYASLSSLYAETGWEKLNIRRKIRKLSLFYNIVKGDTLDGFGMVTCTVSPLSRFTTHLLPVYRATYK